MTSLGYAIKPLSRPPETDIVVPGSKSHTNRALLCAALAEGTSTLQGALDADDTQAMIGVLKSLSIPTEWQNDDLVVHGSAGSLRPGPTDVYVNQSGTTGRFVLPMITLGQGPYTLDGDEQLRVRPFGPLIEALRLLGGSITGEKLPLKIGSSSMKGGTVKLPGSTSSQFLSGLLLSAPLFGDDVVLEIVGDLVSKPYVDLTLATMETFGVHVENDSYKRFHIAPQRYQAARCRIEPDASAASYFFAAAAITGGTVNVVGLDSTTVQGDVEFVEALRQMGARVTYGQGSVTVTGPDQLAGINLDMSDISDTAQTLAVVASFADAPTTISGIGFIRFKETDRIAAVVKELSRQGIRAEEQPDGLIVYPGVPSGGLVETYDDHRMAMSFSLLGLAHDGIVISNPGCVAKTFPTFFQVLDQLR